MSRPSASPKFCDTQSTSLVRTKQGFVTLLVAGVDTDIIYHPTPWRSDELFLHLTLEPITRDVAVRMLRAPTKPLFHSALSLPPFQC